MRDHWRRARFLMAQAYEGTCRFCDGSGIGKHGECLVCEGKGTVGASPNCDAAVEAIDAT